MFLVRVIPPSPHLTPSHRGEKEAELFGVLGGRFARRLFYPLHHQLLAGQPGKLRVAVEPGGELHLEPVDGGGKRVFDPYRIIHGAHARS